MGIGTIYQLSVALAAMLLFGVSMTTSRKHRTKHRRLMLGACALVAASVIGLAAAVLLDAADDPATEPLLALLPLATLLLSVVSILRAQRAKRLRQSQQRYRRAVGRPHELGSRTSRS